MTWLEDIGYAVACVYVLTIIGIMTSISTLLYVIFKLKINRLIKGIFIAMAAFNGSNFSMMLISLIILNFSDMACYFFSFGFGPGNGAQGLFISMMSVVRYYMTWKASKAQIASEGFITSGLIAISSLYFTIMVIIGMDPTLQSWCTGQQAGMNILVNPQLIFSDVLLY